MIALFLALACASYEASDFATDLALSTCKLYEDCAILGVSDEYADMDDCVDKVAASVPVDSCAFDAEQAQDCVNALNGTACDALYEDDWRPASCDAACPE